MLLEDLLCAAELLDVQVLEMFRYKPRQKNCNAGVALGSKLGLVTSCRSLYDALLLELLCKGQVGGGILIYLA